VTALKLLPGMSLKKISAKRDSGLSRFALDSVIGSRLARGSITWLLEKMTVTVSGAIMKLLSRE
jgi:hypothetical protein